MALAEADFVPFPTTVLIADDDASVRRLLRIAFELDGYRTITAADGDEAVAAVRLHQPGIVIVDAAMPGRSGTAVCRCIRSELGWTPRHAALEEIIASAWQWMQRHPNGYAP